MLAWFVASKKTEDGTESYRAPKSVFHGVVSFNAQRATRRAVRNFRHDHQNVPSGSWMPDGAEGTKEHRGAEDVVQPKRRGSHQHQIAGDINWGEK